MECRLAADAEEGGLGGVWFNEAYGQQINYQIYLKF